MLIRNDDDAPRGYAKLTQCDSTFGQPNGGGGLFVPCDLAVELNGWRVTLTSQSQPEDFIKAAAALPRRLLDPLTRRKVLAAIGTAPAISEATQWKEQEEDLAKEQDQSTTDTLRDADDTAQAPGVEKTAVQDSTPEGQHEHGAHGEFGCYVHVYQHGAMDNWLTKHAKLIKHHGSKTSAEGRHLLAIKELHDRGPARVVLLTPGWEVALRQLRLVMPNFGHVIEVVARQCKMAKATGAPLQIEPILLVGGPGVGKSYFAQELAKALGLPSFVYNLESAESTSTMLGTEKHWSSSEPGVLYQLIVEGDVANPLILLDELDKAPAGQWGHYKPRDALIPLLERSTSRNLRDKSAEICFDGSWAIYVATANALSSIEMPMRSRFDVHLVRDLEPTAAVGTVRAMHNSIRDELLLTGFGRPEQDLVRELALLANPRLIGRLLRQAFANAVSKRGMDKNALRLADLQSKEGQQDALASTKH